jgi:surface protein
MGNMFSSCRSLTEIPAFNTSLVTQFGNTFLACINLKTIPSLDMSKATSLVQTFASCVALDVLPPLNVNSSLSFSNVFSGANGIAKAPFFNIRNTFSFTGQMLSRAAILDIFNGLASGVVSKTITVSGNPGFASLTTADRLIATSKGWTIA